jgi:branched-chain amino acid transport system permease protein
MAADQNLAAGPAAATATLDNSAGGPVRMLRRKQAWKAWEIAFWLVTIAVYFAFPSKLLLMSEIAILGLFALSLDLLLGYAGIISLGHAAFFGLGAYAAGLFAMHVSGAPLLGLAAAGAVAGVLGFASSFLVLRGSDLTRLMVTLAVSLMLLEAANQAAWLTGGADGLPGMTVDPVLGLFDFDLFGRTAYLYSLAVLFVLFLIARRLAGSPFGLSLKAIKGNVLRTQSLGIRPNRRLIAIYTISSVYAGIAGALLCQTTQFVSLDVLSFQRSADGLLVLVIGGSGYLYGGLIGAIIFKFLQDWISAITAQYWLFWLGLILVAIVLFGRDRITAVPRMIVSAIRRRLPGADA